jgi:hypothetical protein
VVEATVVVVLAVVTTAPGVVTVAMGTEEDRIAAEMYVTDRRSDRALTTLDGWTAIRHQCPEAAGQDQSNETCGVCRHPPVSRGCRPPKKLLQLLEQLWVLRFALKEALDHTIQLVSHLTFGEFVCRRRTTGTAACRRPSDSLGFESAALGRAIDLDGVADEVRIGAAENARTVVDHGVRLVVERRRARASIGRRLRRKRRQRRR